MAAAHTPKDLPEGLPHQQWSSPSCQKTAEPYLSSLERGVVLSVCQDSNSPDVAGLLPAATPHGDPAEVSRSCTPVSDMDSGYDIGTVAPSLSSLAEVGVHSPNRSSSSDDTSRDTEDGDSPKYQPLGPVRWTSCSTVLNETHTPTSADDDPFKKESTPPSNCFLVTPCPNGGSWLSGRKVPCDQRSLDSGVYDSTSNIIILNIPAEKETGHDQSKEDGPIEEHSHCTIKPEPIWITALCVFIPFLIAGFGTCGAGLVLDTVKDWDVFRTVKALFIVVPTLLGLKGNLEMTLASRVSTQANLGHLDTVSQQWKITWGNLALIQCQATVLSFLASLFAILMNFVKDGHFDIEHSLLLCASSLGTAVLASFVLGSITLAVVIFSHKWNINPDNVATPIAASLGDVTTLGLLAGIGSAFFITKSLIAPPLVVVIVLLALIPLWGHFTYKNEYVTKVLLTGWAPVLIAVVITSFSGFILESVEDRYKGLPVFQPVINGVGGNLVAVQASRISTYLHQRSTIGKLPLQYGGVCSSPFSLSGRGHHFITALILLAMVAPGHILFGYTITFIKHGDTDLNIYFLPLYLLAGVLQVAILLYLADVLVHWMWRMKIDPDSAAIPILTAMGDFIGTGLLAAAFYFHTG